MAFPKISFQGRDYWEDYPEFDAKKSDYTNLRQSLEVSHVSFSSCSDSDLAGAARDVLARLPEHHFQSRDARVAMEHVLLLPQRRAHSGLCRQLRHLHRAAVPEQLGSECRHFHRGSDYDCVLHVRLHHAICPHEKSMQLIYFFSNSHFLGAHYVGNLACESD